MNLFKDGYKILVNGCKDAIKTVKRTRVMLVLFLLPVLLSTIFGMSITTAFEKDYTLKNIKAAIIFDFEPQKPSEYLDRIDGQALISEGAMLAFDDIEAMDFKRLIISDFNETEAVKSFESVQELSKQEAFKLLRKDKLDILFVMDEQFYSNYIINTATPLKLPAEMKIVTSDDNYLNQQISQTVMAGFAAQMERTWDVDNLTLEQVVAVGVPFNRTSFLQAIKSLFDTDLGPRAVTYKLELISNQRNLTAKEYYPVAMIALFWLFALIYIARRPFKDVQNALQLPNPSDEVKKYTSATFWMTLWVEFFVVCTLQTFVILMWSTIAMSSNWIFNVELIQILSLGLCTLSSIGVALSAYANQKKSVQHLNILESMGIFVMAFAGGSFVPLNFLPNIFKLASKLTPNGLILNALVLQTQGYHMWYMRWDLWMLIGMACAAIVFTIFSVRATRRQIFS